MSQPGKPSLQTIAEAAGVSRMTVSRALRNDPALSARTRDRIRQLARELGYRPNPLVSTLMEQVRQKRIVHRTGVIAHLTTTYPPGAWRSFGYTREVIEGAEARARELGFELEEFCIREPGMTGRRMTEILKARGIRGLLIGKHLRPVSHVSLDWSHFASAATGLSVRRPHLHRVTSDCIHAVNVAVRKLRHLGYRRIGFVDARDNELRNDRLFAAGFLNYQHDVSAKEKVPMAILPQFHEQTFARWFRRHRPEAVLACGFHVLDWLRNAGARVPEDVGFVSLLRFGKPTDCAHVSQKGHVIGATAVELIVAQLHRNEYGLPANPQTVFVQGEWVPGATVRKMN